MSGPRTADEPADADDSRLARLSLDQLTLIDLPPLEFVRVAGVAGFRFVSLFIHSPAPDLMSALDPALDRAMLAALADADVRIGNLECFDLGPQVDVRSYGGALDRGARLGARSATAINYLDPDAARVAERFAAFAALCAERGLRSYLEPFSTGQTRTLADGATVLTASGARGAAVVVDALHLHRTGGSVGDVLALEPAMLGYAQICDAPAEVPDAGIGWESVAGRLDPGEGVLPLVDFVRALPADRLIGVEVPNAARRAASSALDRARALMAAARRVVIPNS